VNAAAQIVRHGRGLFDNAVSSALTANRRRPNLEWLEDRVLLSVVDLTTAGSSGTINGAIYRQRTVSPAGSGNLSSFIRIHQTGTEFGYNTDARPYTDPVLLNGGTDTTATFNRSVALSTVPIVAIGGQAYLDFALDINQTGSSPLISLDEVQISLASSPTLQGYTSNGTYGGQASLAYDMGGSSSTWVKLNGNLSPGSGGSDMFMDIPLSDLPDSAFSGANRSLPLKSGTYVYLYSHFGTQNLNAGDASGSANDGFEQWATPTIGGSISTTSTTIYDAGTVQPIVNPELAGASVKDSATVSGTNGAGTGDVTFLFYHSIDGTGTALGAGTVALNSSGVANYSSILGPLPVGSYSFVAYYNGDTNYLPSASAVEPLTVVKTHPTLSTTPSPSTITLGSSTPPSMTDSATLASGYTPAGSITFNLYAPDGTTVVDAETVTVSGNGTYSMPVGYTLPTLGTVTGTYQWVVSYSGDANNNGVVSSVGSEPVPVHPSSPSLGTNASPGQVTLSSGSPPILTDSATLAGGFHETGTITFDPYAPGGVVPIHTEIVSAGGNGSYTTPTGYTLPTTGTVAGTYQWVATYSGDGNNNGVASARGNEPVVVAPANLLLSTTPAPGNVTLTSGSPPVLKDSAMLTGGFHETGNVVFSLYAAGGVSPVYTETVTVSGNGTYSTLVGYTLPTSGTVIGTYQWVAAYSGDANNTSVTSTKGNESVPVQPANPSLGTNASPVSVTLSSGSPPILTDTATLTGGTTRPG
jgi:Bacterial Ig-like domain (group 3)